MIMRFLEKIVTAVLDFVAPADAPCPAPVNPVPKPILTPDPKQIAAEMRALAARLHQEADRLDPVVWPFPDGVPKLPSRWNAVLDEDGECGGFVKRSGAARVRLEKPEPCCRPNISADDPDPEFEEVEEIAQKLANKWGMELPKESCCGGGENCCRHTEIGKDTIDNFMKVVEEIERKTKP